jgi:Protein of unknown function (DUF2934)
MTKKEDKKRSRKGEKTKLTLAEANEQTRRVQEAVARRAYAISKSHGFGSRHELEDWRQAECDLVRPLCCGRTTVGDSLWIGIDARIFEPGTTEIWVAPRKITVCGKLRTDGVDVQRIGPGSDEERIFRVLDLCIDVDPSHATAKFNGSSLEILVRKAQAKPQQEARAAAA